MLGDEAELGREELWQTRCFGLTLSVDRSAGGSNSALVALVGQTYASTRTTLADVGPAAVVTSFTMPRSAMVDLTTAPARQRRRPFKPL
jgi:hypothetical protein